MYYLLVNDHRRGGYKHQNSESQEWICHLLQESSAVYVNSPLSLLNLQTCAMIVKYQISVKLSPAYSYMTVLEITFEC